MDLAPSVLAGKPVRGFVQKSDQKDQHPEFSNVGKALMSEVVVLETVTPDFAPPVDPDVGGKGKQHEVENPKAAAKNKPQISVDFSEEFIGVPGGKIYLCQVSEA